MAVEELIEKTKIGFPRPIGLKQTEEMLCYISSHLPANVSQKVEYHKRFDYDPEKDGSLENNGTLKVIASIHKMSEPFEYDTFVSYPYDKDTSFISGVKFEIVPGWNLSEYRPEVRELWDDVRNCINHYFKDILKV